jgi:hypothetical protein
MMNVTKPAGAEVRGRRNAPFKPLHRKIKQAPRPRPFDAVAYAAVLEVLG